MNRMQDVIEEYPDDLNLENKGAAPADSKLTRQGAAYFDKLWKN
ncbi:hypothetical protein ACFQY3_07530 [Paenibacillus farraposensis]|nr:hypothetical protein [Paenibacillus farraposensis]